VPLHELKAPLGGSLAGGAALGSTPVNNAVHAAVVPAAPLQEVREALGLFGTEPDDSARLAPWLLERVAHVPDDRLGRRLPHALKRSPTLPGRFQPRGRMLCTCNQLWITHRAIPP
jgi:hypothetical protein